MAGRAHSAVAELYAIESRLSAARARLASLQAETASVRKEQASTKKQLAIVKRVFTVADRQLRERVIALYETQEPNALGAFLDAGSLNEAAVRLESLGSLAGQDRSLIRQASASRVTLRRVSRKLAARAERLRTLEASAAQAAASLESARAERTAYVEQLSSQRRLNTSQISSLESEAQAADARAQEVTAQASVAPAPEPAVATSPAPASSGAMTVVATAYALGGTTATGVPVGPGIVAVDPSVIPLGTRMTIPGYGEGVAADTGSAIQGTRIDVWVPTEAAALQWGVRTVTIYLH